MEQANHLRILELRDRLRVDPAPFVYAQLAEEYRRAREVDHAVASCRECLALFPAYLSVRVILGRALAERGDLEAAAQEFEHVLASAPENLTATRDLAEIALRRGQLERALDLFRQALVLFRHDANLEERVRLLTQQLAESESADGARPAQANASPVFNREPALVPGPATAAVDFDRLLESLGAGDQPLPPLMEMLLGPAQERGAHTPPPTRATGVNRQAAGARRLVAQLEGWLRVIEHRRAAATAHANRPA